MRRTHAILATLLLLAALITLRPASTRADGDSPDAKRLVTVPIADAPAYAKRALVIGVDDYTIAHPLTDCGNDARAFAALLQSRFGFEHVTVMTDDAGKALLPTEANVRHQLRLLLDGVVPDKTELVLFYSGHGTRTHDAASGDADWLVPEDGDPQDIPHTCVNYTEFKTQLDTSRPARAFLVMDACRDLFGGKGTAGSGFGGKSLSLGPQVAELQSCQPTQVSQEGVPTDFAQSVFTHFLIKGLSGDPDATADDAHTVVTFDSLKVYLQGQVSQYVSEKFNQEQLPAGTATLGGMVLAKLAPVVTPSGPAAGTTRINPKDGAEMVYVPAGPFLMGDDDRADNPRHTVTLSGYWMYKNDVTVAMYKKFCDATGRQMPAAPSFGWQEDHPIVKVTWDDAAAYCAWAVVHLPTEAQWEKAARGTDGRQYPWGDTWAASRLWCSKGTVRDAGSTSSVGAFASGASPYGCLDMEGNVWNWCSDWYDKDYWKSDRGTDPTEPGFGTTRVVRGGSWILIDADSFRASLRGCSAPANGGTGSFGFRGASGP